MIDGIDLERLPEILSAIGKGEAVYKRQAQLIDDYLEEFPEGVLAKEARTCKASLTIKKDEPLPTAEELVEILEEVEATKAAAKKSRRKSKGTKA